MVKLGNSNSLPWRSKCLTSFPVEAILSDLFVLSALLGNGNMHWLSCLKVKEII